MKKFIAILLLSLTSSLYALPSCPPDKNQIYDNCFGTETFDNGNYVGEWKDNKMHGQGTYAYANGDKYVGKWRDNMRHGQGTYTYLSGNKYVGWYKDDKRHRRGTYTWKDGDKYIGKYKDDKRHGRGIFTTINGDKYVGEFKDNKRHGQGTYTFPDGAKDSGYWMNGEFVPDICEGMGLSEDTSEFGQCVLKLIDKL